jgi:hypothetical protein
MPVYKIESFRGGLSDYEDKGTVGSFKFGQNLDIRKTKDTLSAGQALVDEGEIVQSASRSVSPSSSASFSPSASTSPSSSSSASLSPSSSRSPSAGSSPSLSRSPSASNSPSASTSPSASLSPSNSTSLSPSPSFGLKSVFQDLILWFVKSSDGNLYGFGNTGKVYKRLPDGTWLQVYDNRERITGAYEWQHSNGKVYLYFADYHKLHRKEIPGRSDWNDVNATTGWPKTNLTTYELHTMREIGGDLIICNYNFLALVGYDESYTNEALRLVPGDIARTLVDRNGRTIIGTAKAYALDKGFNGAIDAEIPLAQIGDDGQLYYNNMRDNIPMKRFPGGGKVNPGGVTNEIEQVNSYEWEPTALSYMDKQEVGNMSLWGVYDADSGKNGIYSYGRRNKNHPFVLNLEYELDVDEIGAVINAEGVTLASYRDGSLFGVKRVDVTQKAIGVYEGLDLKAPIKKPGDITNWKRVELFCQPLPSGCSIEVWYRVDKTGSFVKALLANGDSNYSVVGGKEAVFRIVAAGKIDETKVVIYPFGNETPEINWIHVYFE